MNIAAAANAILFAKSAQTQTDMTMSLLKMAAEQQNQMVNVLAQISQQGNSGYNFSVYV